MLRLIGCDLCWQDLSALLLELRALQLLVLVCCHVTSGCGPEGLTIVSSSLTRLEKALCTASGGIRLDYAPRLTILSAGVQPLGTGGQLRLDLRTLGALRELHGLTILLHDLGTSTLPSSCSLHCADQLPVIISSPVSAVDDPEPEPMDPDPPLGVHLHMSSPHGVTEFLDLLRYMPYLIELTVTVRNCSIQFHSACYKHQFNRFIACWQRLDSTHPTEALQSD